MNGEKKRKAPNISSSLSSKYEDALDNGRLENLY